MEALIEAAALLEKTNANLEPELLTSAAAREALAAYSRIQKLAAYGTTVLARKIRDAEQIARTTGTSIGRAKAALDAAEVLAAADTTRDAFRAGELSFDQAAEIGRAEKAVPGSAPELVSLAGTGSFQTLRHEARRVALGAEASRGLPERQRAARRGASHSDELGMVHIHLALEPHVGAPIVKRAEAAAARLHRRAKTAAAPEPFERHLADAYAGMLAGSGTASTTRPELVVLVSHEVAKRGWKDVSKGEVCKIPGVGPVSPETAREIAGDAFLTGPFYDGKDLRHLRRWTRNIPVEVRLALQLGEPPRFDGPKCVDCGKRFGTENDHVQPHCAGGPASVGNLEPRCRSCHRAKTEGDRRAGKLRPPEP